MASQLGNQTTYPFIFLTNRIGRLLSGLMRPKLFKVQPSLTPQHIGILAELWIQDGLKQQDLAVNLILDKATITRALRKLEKADLIVRITDATDKRNKRIYLTHSGKTLKTQLLPRVHQLEEEATAGLTQAEIVNCLHTLEKIYHNLQQLQLQPIEKET